MSKKTNLLKNAKLTKVLEEIKELRQELDKKEEGPSTSPSMNLEMAVIHFIHLWHFFTIKNSEIRCYIFIQYNNYLSL